MSIDKNNSVLSEILEKIELPDSAYEKAGKRYNDIGEWLHRKESRCAAYSPHVFPQGSFRLGTAIRPESEEEYDIDIGCKFASGISKKNITQKQLKTMVGEELELYRQARNIEEDVEEKRRCWRIEYKDELRFHMDVVPCIPENQSQQTFLKKRMMDESAMDEALAHQVAELAVSITDNADREFDHLSDNWRSSNPEGFAKWFESRMRTAKSIINERELSYKASIDALPYYKWKTPLQSAVQLLKRHRDTMFKDNDDAKPISAILTTLAAKAYNGEGDLVTAIENILERMSDYVNLQAPHVPNPVNPDEDFADKWYSEEHAHLNLRESFYMWLQQAKTDFQAICAKDNSQRIVDVATRGFAVHLRRKTVESVLGLTPLVAATPTRIDASSSPRPWCER